MKTLIAVTSILFTLGSCKKDRVCECSSSTQPSKPVKTYPESKRKDAKEDCKGFEGPNYVYEKDTLGNQTARFAIDPKTGQKITDGNITCDLK